MAKRLIDLVALELRAQLPAWIAAGIVSYRIAVDPFTTGRPWRPSIRCAAQRERQRRCMARLRAERAGKEWIGEKRVRAKRKPSAERNRAT